MDFTGIIASIYITFVYCFMHFFICIANPLSIIFGHSSKPPEHIQYAALVIVGSFIIEGIAT